MIKTTTINDNLLCMYSDCALKDKCRRKLAFSEIMDKCRSIGEFDIEQYYSFVDVKPNNRNNKCIYKLCKT